MSNARAALPLSLLAMVAFASEALAKSRAAAHPRPITQAQYTEGGYADRASVAQGQTIALHIASGVRPLQVEIYDLAHPAAPLLTLANLVSEPRDCTGLSSTGCRWPATISFAVPPSWRSGFYAARFPTTRGTRWIFFVVRAADPGEEAPVLVVSSTHTFQAYNTFGGRSVYPSNSPERVHRVSYARPYHDHGGLGRYPRWEERFVDWMTEQNRPFEAATDVDLEDPTLLPHYALVVFVGHSEYWTAGARANLDAYSAMGGHVAIFGGNTMWWQARLEKDGRELVTYKSAITDPERGRNDAVVTTNWFAEPVLRPENTSVGASFRHAGLTNLDGPHASYTVTRPSHWVFDGSNVSRGDTFGSIAAGAETDGVLYNCDFDGLALAPDGSDATPLHYRILATVPAAEGHGTVGLFVNEFGGAVFNAGTQDWVLGLGNDPVVETITRNVMSVLSSGDPLPYEHVDSNGIRMRELFNCPLDTTGNKILPGWRGDEGGLEVTPRCAFEGRSGLELSGGEQILIGRDFAPTGNTLGDVHIRFDLDAGHYGSGAPFGLLSLQNRTLDAVATVARVELDPANRAVRVVQYNANNASTASDWIALGDGWRSVQWSWRSPGAVTLQVDNGAVHSVHNATAGQRAGDVAILHPGGGGYLCIDALVVGTHRISR